MMKKPCKKHRKKHSAYHANVLNFEDTEVNRFFCEALFKIGYEESMEALLPTVLKVGEINLKCMALLDKANTETYGTLSGMNRKQSASC